MLVNYKDISDYSRVIIFPSSRKFYEEEVPEINNAIGNFLEGFDEIKFHYKLKYNRFVIIFISEDTLLDLKINEEIIAFIQNLEKNYQVSLIDKIRVFFKQGEYVQVKEVPDFKKMIKSRSLSKSTIVFNNFIYTRSEFDCCWEVPAEESWISHFFK